MTYATAAIDQPPDCQLVTVAGPGRESADRWARPHQAQVFTEVGADVVVVAGVHGDRGRVVVDALNADRHVLADKPLCTTLADFVSIAGAPMWVDTPLAATIAGLDDRGELAPGASADLLVLDDGCQVLTAVVAGEVV